MSHLLTSLTILLSVLVLVGWTFDINILSRPVSGTAAMNSLTAICFILSGLSLILLKRFGSTSYLKILGIILASVVLTLAVVILVEIFFDTDTRIDTWLFYDKMNTGIEGFTLNYMAPNTAFCFIITSVAILMLDKRTRNRWIPSEFLALFVGFVAMIILIGYLYSVEAFYTIFEFFPMAIYTAISFLLITLAILFSNKNKGFISKFLRPTMGSAIARKLIPTAIILPILLGFIRLYLEDNGFVSNEFGVGLLVMCNMGIFILIIWIYALELNKKDVLRKSAELITIETSSRLRLATQAGIWELDVVNNKLLWDKQMCALYGLTANTFGGDYEAWRKTIHPDDAERSHNEVQASIHEGYEYSSEFRVVWPDSSIKTIKATAKIERNKEGKALKFTGVNWDISDIKKVEESLKLFRTLIDNSNDSFEVLDPDTGRFLDVNEKGCKELGYSRDEFLKLSISDIDPIISPQSFKEVVKELRKSDFMTWEGIHNRKDGTSFPVEVNIRIANLEKEYMVAVSRDISLRKQNEESVLKLSRAVEQSPVSIIITDLKGTIEYTNPKVTAITGYQSSELIGQNPRILSSGNKSKEDYSKLWQTISNENEWFGEFLNKKKNGELYWEYASISPIIDVEGKMTHYLAVKEDITERKKLVTELIKAKEHVEESETRFRNLFENAPESILVLDITSGKFIGSNNNASKLFKFSHEELTKKRPVDITPEFQPDGSPTAEGIEAHVRKVLKGKKISLERMFCDANRKEIFCEVHFILLPDTDQPQIYVSIIDITKKNETREKLKQSENQFRNLFENAPNSVVVIDLKSEKFVNSNQNALNLFKSSLEELAEIGPVDISPEFQPDGNLSSEKAKVYIEKAILGEKVTFEWMHCDSNKKEILCEVHLAFLPSTNNPQIYANIIDITVKNKTREKLKQQFEDLEIANQELKKTNNELDRFVYSTSHDLRSPLKSLLGLFELMKDDVDPENTNQLELIGMMKKSIVKLDNFIEDILQYSRNARTEVSKEAIDFKPTIDNIINNLKHMDGAKEIKLKMEIDQDLKFVADRVRVNVVLNNLISNAIKYKDLSKKQQFLGIQIKNSNDNAVITIEDNGIGIDPKDKEKIFDMFYRGTNTSTGSGLGLYIVKEAINKLDGSIKIQSELNKGTTFIATLPNQLIALN